MLITCLLLNIDTGIFFCTAAENTIKDPDRGETAVSIVGEVDVRERSSAQRGRILTRGKNVRGVCSEPVRTTSGSFG